MRFNIPVINNLPKVKPVLSYFNPVSPVEVFVPLPPRVAGKGKWRTIVQQYIPPRDLRNYQHLLYKCTIEVRISSPRHAKKGNADLDNLVKRILDALKGCLYFDDVQIIELHASFVIDGPPGFWVKLEPIHPAVVDYTRGR